VELKDLVIWDVMTGSESMSVKEAFKHEVTSMCADIPLQRKLYVGNSIGEVSVLSITTGSQLSCLSVHASAVSSIAYCEYSKHLISFGADRCIVILSEHTHVINRSCSKMLHGRARCASARAHARNGLLKGVLVIHILCHARLIQGCEEIHSEFSGCGVIHF
jgi:hypothetical protein